MKKGRETGIHTSAPDLVEKYGSFFKITLPDNVSVTNDANTSTVMCCDPELLREIYDRPEDFQKMGWKDSTTRKNGTGAGLFPSDDDEPLYHQASRILRPAFSQKGMKEYFPIIQNSTMLLARRFESASTDAKLIDTHKIMSAFTFDVISKVCFSHDFGSLTSDEPNEFLTHLENTVDAAVTMRKYPSKALGTAGLVLSGQAAKSAAASKYRQAVNQSMLDERKALLGTLQPSSSDPATGGAEEASANAKIAAPNDMLTRMLTEADPVTGQKLPDDNIMAQITTFLVAGHDSTSSTITTLLYNVCLNPDVERRVYEEVVGVCGADPDAPITWAQLASLPYCNTVLQENMRLYPAAPAFFKRTRADRAVLLGKYELPPATDIEINTWGLARNPAVWPEPTKFDPSRWTEESARGRSPFASLPFSYGTRGCIGRQLSLLEQRMALAYLVRKFHLTVDPSSDLKVDAWVFTNPEGVRIKATPRAPPSSSSSAVLHHHCPGTVTPDPAPSQQHQHDLDSLPESTKSALGQKRLLVLYGSNTGTAADLAARVASNGRKVGMDTTMCTLDEAVAAAAASSAEIGVGADCSRGGTQDRGSFFPRGDEGAVVVVTSTYNGRAPDNAVKFSKWVGTPAAAAALAGVRVAVFGVGNSQWSATYLGFGKQLLQKMAGAGAVPMLKAMGEADVDKGQEDWEMARWQTKLLGAVLTANGLPVPDALSAGSKQGAPSHQRLVQYEVLVVDGASATELAGFSPF